MSGGRGSPERVEVLVAGAGPAGVAAAVAVVRAEPSLRGRVVVLDRARFPRAKPCGGGLTGHVDAAMAALGLELTVPCFPSPRAVVRYGHFTREVALPRPVKVIRREEFDASLVAQARDLGVEVREGVALTGYTVEQDAVHATTSRGELRAAVLVGADGAGSLVRKRLGDGARDGGARESGAREGGARESGARDSGPGDGGAPARERGERSSSTGDSAASRRAGRTPIRLFRAELSGAVGEAMVYDFTPMRDGLRGYLWIFPVPGGRLNVGLMHSPSVKISGGELAALLRARLREHGVELRGELRGWPAWPYEPSRRVAAPRVLTVGDAAGIDALTGEGIAVGMEHGLVAGAAIARAFSTGDFRFADYRRALRRADVGRDLALDGWLARMLYRERRYRGWLSLMLHDQTMLELYAARVSGALVLADRKRALVAALLRHLLRAPSRVRALRAAEGPSTSG